MRKTQDSRISPKVIFWSWRAHQSAAGNALQIINTLWIGLREATARGGYAKSSGLGPDLCHQPHHLIPALVGHTVMEGQVGPDEVLQIASQVSDNPNQRPQLRDRDRLLQFTKRQVSYAQVTKVRKSTVHLPIDRPVGRQVFGNQVGSRRLKYVRAAVSFQLLQERRLDVRLLQVVEDGLKADHVDIGVEQKSDPQGSHQQCIPMQNGDGLSPIAVLIGWRLQSVTQPVRSAKGPRTSGGDRNETNGVLQDIVDASIGGHAEETLGPTLGTMLPGKARKRRYWPGSYFLEKSIKTKGELPVGKARERAFRIARPVP